MTSQRTQQEAWEERVNYSEVHDCIFIHIPKTAGSSIAKLLGLEVSSHLTFQELIQTRFYQLNPGLPVFAIVRDPLARFISLYNYARMPISSYHNNIEPSKAIYGAHSDYQRLATASLDEAIDDLVNHRLVHDKRWNQWRPQTFWTQGPDTPLESSIKVVHLENLSAGIASILGTCEREIPHLNRSESRSDSTQPSHQQLRKLVDYYNNDYKHFGYDNPSQKQPES